MESTVKYFMKEIDNKTFFTLLELELAERRSVRFRVKGISMQPMLRNNRDEVQLVPCADVPLSLGDICLFKFQGRYILHRYIRREGELYYFQGDNVLKNFEYCERRDIVGVVQTIYRDGKSLPPMTVNWKIRINLNRLKQHLRLRIAACLPKKVKDALKVLLGIKNQR